MQTGLRPIPDELNDVTSRIIGCAIAVHRALGPGFLEKIYREAMCLELAAAGVRFKKEVAVTVRYRDTPIAGHRLDLVVEDGVILELKAVRRLRTIHRAQLHSCLKASGLRVGLLVNFRVELLKAGIRRVVL
jgi:GxxExxY protein